jgi:hypothetical protein
MTITVRSGALVFCRTPSARCIRAAEQPDGVDALDFDLELAPEDEEELVIVVVLLPVEVAFDHAQPYDGVVRAGVEKRVAPARPLGARV